MSAEHPKISHKLSKTLRQAKKVGSNSSLYTTRKVTMKDYHNLYLKCDVLLLADEFKKFRNNSLKNYGLYPSHYLSALGSNWNAMLKMTE